MVLLVDEKAISQEKGAWLIRETDLRLCVPSQWNQRTLFSSGRHCWTAVRWESYNDRPRKNNKFCIAIWEMATCRSVAKLFLFVFVSPPFPTSNRTCVWEGLRHLGAIQAKIIGPKSWTGVVAHHQDAGRPRERERAIIYCKSVRCQFPLGLVETRASQTTDGGTSLEEEEEKGNSIYETLTDVNGSTAEAPHEGGGLQTTFSLSSQCVGWCRPSFGNDNRRPQKWNK